ncbi:MAG TPA: hypothetical protein VMR81_05960 [Patescibacteria group bacterium]|nr:hypothetical protein [Patescibacteria group bacterium]
MTEKLQQISVKDIDFARRRLDPFLNYELQQKDPERQITETLGYHFESLGHKLTHEGYPCELSEYREGFIHAIRNVSQAIETDETQIQFDSLIAINIVQFVNYNDKAEIGIMHTTGYIDALAFLKKYYDISKRKDLTFTEMTHVLVQFHNAAMGYQFS